MSLLKPEVHTTSLSVGSASNAVDFVIHSFCHKACERRCFWILELSFLRVFTFLDDTVLSFCLPDDNVGNWNKGPTVAALRTNDRALSTS
jgi:hypothetical protein